MARCFLIFYNSEASSPVFLSSTFLLPSPLEDYGFFEIKVTL